MGAALFLALGCTRNQGEFTYHAVIALLLSVPLMILAGYPVLVSRMRAQPAWLWPLGIAMLAWLNLSPSIRHGGLAETAALTTVLGAAAIMVSLRPLHGWTWLAVASAAATDIGLAFVGAHWGYVHIDVFWFTQGATGQLLSGHNPYAAVYPTTTPGVLSAHYPYGPGLLLIASPFRLLGDVRTANAVAMLGVFAGIAILARRHLDSDAAGRVVALALAVPFAPFMIFQAWPEVYPLAGLTVWLVLRDRHPWLGTSALALGLATVPTTVPLLALPWLWWHRARLEVTVAAAGVIAISLPFAAWAGFSRFWADTVLLQLRLPTRHDGLSINGLLYHLHQPLLAGWVGVAMTAAFLILAALLGRREWESAMKLGAGLLLIAFLTAKWAFFDYYFLVTYALVLGMALARPTAAMSRELVRPARSISDRLQSAWPR